MIDRLYVPFDVFGMREEVRVSTMVRVGDLGWTCGMCPLDVNSAVVAAGDLERQAGFVCEMIKDVFKRAGFGSNDVAKLVIYHAAKSADELEQMLSAFRTHFPNHPVLVPVPVGYFYYDGMMVEVDAYADASLEPASDEFSEDIQIRLGQDLTYVAATAVRATGIKAALNSRDLDPESVISAQWYSSGFFEDSNGEDTPLVARPQEFVRVEASDAALFSADLTFARRFPVITEQSDDGVLVRSAGDIVMFSCSVARADLNLVEQTQVVMARLDRALSREGLEWSHVVKISAPYVGGASEADLHENLRIRHGFHALPGPASTGLPVRSFADPDCRIVVRLTAYR